MVFIIVTVSLIAWKANNHLGKTPHDSIPRNCTAWELRVKNINYTYLVYNIHVDYFLS